MRMTPLSIDLQGDDSWKDLAGREVKEGMLTRVAALAHATEEGRAAVALRVELEDGTVVVAHTTMRLFLAAARAFAARYAEETA